MKANILIVDDSSLARRTVRQVLETMGHSCEEASDGAQALERYYLHRHDLIFLDMVMDGLYGLDVLAKLRELNPQVRVIVSTADIQQSTRDQALAAGALGFISKPVNRAELPKLVAAALEHGAAA